MRFTKDHAMTTSHERRLRIASQPAPMRDPSSRGSAFSRRDVLGAAAAAVLVAPARLALARTATTASPDDARLVFVLLRGGLDGLAAVPAIGDADFASARGALASYATPPLALDGTPFALHPSLASLHAIYRRGEAAVIHATGLASYTERSHFDAQQVLESGGERPYALATGWLGRALAAMTPAGGLALTTAVPLVLRGTDRIDTWAASTLPDPAPDLLGRLEVLYADDGPLREALARARQLRAQGPADAMPRATSDAAMASGEAGSSTMAGATRPRALAATLAHKAGEFLAAPRGPRVAVIEIGGWDTHANQMTPNGALANQLHALDTTLDALRASLGRAWARTVVLVATEFGRTVAANGTLGSDHGTGGAAFVLGGPVKGGRVLTDWPGLGARDRHEGRDLRITTDLRAVTKGLLVDHLRIAARTVEVDVLPGTGTTKAVELLA
jgi:uncharacterized protein (DUF1501 family)